MPKIDFDSVDDAPQYDPLPEGTYICRVANVKEAVSSNGNDMWNMTFEVVDGEYIKRLIFDRLTFTPRAMPRIKFFLRKVGVDVSGEVDLVPELVANRIVKVSVGIEPYKNAEGLDRLRNNVLFMGFESVDAATLQRIETVIAGFPDQGRSAPNSNDGEEVPF